MKPRPWFVMAMTLLIAFCFGMWMKNLWAGLTASNVIILYWLLHD